MGHDLLKGKRGIIFGALDEQSIAWHVAEHCHAEGAQLVLTNAPVAMRFGKIQELSEKLHAPVISADATVMEDLETLLKKSVEHLGGNIDFILHSIGMSLNVRKKKNYTDVNHEWMLKTFDISAVSFHKLMQTAYQLDVLSEGASILALSYIAAQRVFPDYSEMAESKALLESFARSFGYHLGIKKKVRVNTISQSPTWTTAGSGVQGSKTFSTMPRICLRLEMRVLMIVRAIASPCFLIIPARLQCRICFMMADFQPWVLIPRSLGNKRLNISFLNHGTSTTLRAFVLMCCILIVIKGHSQAPSLEAPATRTPAQATEVLDSVPSKLFLTPGDFYAPSQQIHDTLDYNHHRYDPADRAMYPYATLGNLGSPARSLYYEMPKSKGLNAGHQAYDLYKVNFEDFRFYDTDIALSRLDYTQGLSQDDAMIRAAFGRNFDKGVNLSVNYQRINQLGQYTRQRAKNTAFGIGVLYRSPKGKLDGIYHYLSNSIVHEDNGGVDNVEFWLDSINLKRNVPLRLVDALTTHRTRQLTIQHHLHLFGSANDSVARKADLDIIHTLKTGSWLVKFSDVELTGDEPAYYSEFVTDDRGMRNFLSNQIIDNAVDLQFRYQNKSSDVPSHLLRTGLQLRNSDLDHEPDKSKVQEMFLNASGRLGISSKISLDGQAYIGFLDAIGEYRLDANARLSLFKDATTWAQLNLYQRKPSLVERRLFINQIPVWSTDFKNVSLSSVQFHYVHPSFRLRLHGAAHLVSNMIYFDASRLPQQLGQSVEILQMSASKEFRVGPFGVYGHLMLQEYDVEQVALPHLIFNGQLFYTGRWFKKALLVRVGLDVLVTDAYNGVSYFPGTGQFYFDDAFLIPQYPAIDIFYSMQVKDIFKAFIKLENATALVSEDHFVQIYDYPQFETYVRFGLWMKLFD